MSYFKVTKHSDSLYVFSDPLGVVSTLIVGSKKALLIDTCYGVGDLKEAIREITDKELIVFASHGHLDHTMGNYQFDEVWIHKDDVELCKKHNSYEMRKNIVTKNKERLPEGFDKELYLMQNEGNLRIFDGFLVVDLGDLDVEVFHIPGHTQGSIGFYVKRDKLMFVSDMGCTFIWLFFEEATPLSVFIKSVEKILSYDFNFFIEGHMSTLLPRSKMERLLEASKNVDINKSVKVGLGENSYCYSTGKIFDPKEVGVVFDPRKMN